MLIEVFKTGTHEDSKGNTRTWTDDDLDIIAQKYNPKEHEAPVVIGHPKDNAPAYGWVEGLEQKGGVLYAKLKDLVPEFVGAVKKGLYKKRSISLYPDMTLRHVGFLGAVPPAIKGLADVQFKEEEDEGNRTYMTYTTYSEEKEFEENNSTTPTPPYQGGELNKKKEERKGMEDYEGRLKEAETKLKEEQERSSAAAQQLKEKEDEAQGLRAELEAEKSKQRKTEFNIFCEGLQREGRLTPAMKPAVMDFMEIFHGTGEYEFAEGGSAEARKKGSAIEKFKGFLNGTP